MRVLLTVDVDWAPDAAIDFTADLLVRHKVKSTWFLTHDSPAIQRLKNRPELFELGIHPNFLAGSSHGATPEEVLDFCMNLVPDAVSMRTHALVQSTPLLDLVIKRTPIRFDLSLLLPHAHNLELVEYQWNGPVLLRLPYHWGDDLEMMRKHPSWKVETALEGDGFRVFDFHPIHVFLNSADMGPYGSLKAAVKPLNAATAEQMRPFVHPGIGSQTVFTALAEHLAKTGSECARDVYESWRKSQ